MAKKSPDETHGKPGPKTETGRANSSRNATKHGMTARQLLIPGESQADLDLLLAQYHAKYPSTDPVLESLVTRAAEYDWFLQRNQRGYDATMQKLYKTEQQHWTEADHAVSAPTATSQPPQRQLDRARQQILQDYRESRATRRLELATTPTAKEPVPEPAPPPKTPFQPIYQSVEILVINGQTRIKPKSTNQQIITDLDRIPQIRKVERTIRFIDKIIPPKYSWLPVNNPIAKVSYTFTPDEFRDHAAREPDGRILPTKFDTVTFET